MDERTRLDSTRLDSLGISNDDSTDDFSKCSHSAVVVVSVAYVCVFVFVFGRRRNEDDDNTHTHTNLSIFRAFPVCIVLYCIVFFTVWPHEDTTWNPSWRSTVPPKYRRERRHYRTALPYDIAPRPSWDIPSGKRPTDQVVVDG